MLRRSTIIDLTGTAACWTLLLVITAPAPGQMVTFNGAMPGSPYILNDVFPSEGVQFQVDEFQSAIGPLVGPRVHVGPTPFGFPPGMDPSAYPNNLNLDMDLVGTVGTASHLSMLFTDNGGTVNLYVNGLQTDIPLMGPDFFSFHGSVINGVSVSVLPTGTGVPGHGQIELFGDIDRFVFGGQEAVFDNIWFSPLFPNQPGDYNGDEAVGSADLNLTLFNWGVQSEDLGADWKTNRPARGMTVGTDQLNATLFNWGATPSAAAAVSAVPEPTAIASLAMGVIGLLSIARRRQN